jgi:hypothetical protein
MTPFDHFQSSMRHHNFRSEMLQWAGLFQQQQMINYQAQTIAELQISEQNRQQERMLDIWSAEFVHRGHSPLEAAQLADNEWQIQILMSFAKKYAEQYEFEFTNAVNNVKAILSKKAFGSLRVSLDPDYLKEQVSAFRRSKHLDYQNKISEISEKLNMLGPSLLFDDKEFRRSIEADKSNEFSELEMLSGEELYKYTHQGLRDSYESLRSDWFSRWRQKSLSLNSEKQVSREILKLVEYIDESLARVGDELGFMWVEARKNKYLNNITVSQISESIEKIEKSLRDYQLLVARISAGE